MSHENIARRWGRAVFELGKESNSLAALNRDMASFAEVYSSSRELSGVLENPLVPEPAREAILRDIAARLSLSETATSTLRLLSKKRRIVALPEIARYLARLVDADANVVRAEVTSAGPLTEAYLNRLKSELEKATGKTVVISQKQDKSLIGGVITRIGDQVIDGSVRARLDGFRESLLRA
jgi:F-type H+-transporting ATPase subunit delta